MARIRSIKPEFWTSEQVIECSPMARLMFVGLWNFVDDHGRDAFSLKKTKAQIFPADEISLDTILRMFDELSENGLIEMYEVENKQYFFITGWRHQKIDKPQPARFPAPPKTHSTNDRRMVSTEGIGREGIGREKKENNSPASTPLPRELAGQDLKLVDLCVAVVREFERAGRQAPDTNRCAIWLSKGFSPSTVTAVIAEILQKKPDVRTLSYFDGAIADAHKTQAVVEVASGERLIDLQFYGVQWTEKNLVAGIERWRKDPGEWMKNIHGPAPDQSEPIMKFAAERGISLEKNRAEA